MSTSTSKLKSAVFSGRRRKKPRAAAVLLVAAFPLAAASGAHAGGYAVTTVTDPTGTNFINLLGINDSRTIAGFDNFNVNAGFTLTLPNNFTPVTVSGAASNQVTGINAAGDLSGFYVDASGNTHGFTRIGGSISTLDNPAGPSFNQLLGINNADETVGYYAPSPAGSPGQVAYSHSGTTFTPILLPSNVNSQAVGINNLGDIVGFYQTSLSASIGFLDVGGTITPIDPFGSTFAQALGINDSGEIVGLYVDGSNVQHGFIDNGGVFTKFDPAASVSTTINGLNNKGDIVGFYTNGGNDSVIGFVGTPAPEPSTWVAMLLGFAGLGFVGYRAARKPVPIAA